MSVRQNLKLINLKLIPKILLNKINVEMEQSAYFEIDYWKNKRLTRRPEPLFFILFLKIFFFNYQAFILIKIVFIEFVRGTLVNEIIYVSGVQLYKTSSV